MNNYSITQQKSKDDKSYQIVFTGELSFNHIESIFKKTASILKTRPKADIILEDVDILDLSFIQMLISLKKTYQSKVELNLSEDLIELIQVSGFYKYLIEENK